MHQIVTGTLADSHFSERFADPMFRLRYRVFQERMQWDLECRDGQEIDQFDDQHNLYLLATDDDSKPCGGWRLRPTTLPYMMGDLEVFTALLHGAKAPRSPRVWEISRFAVDADAIRSTFGFNDVARSMVHATIQLAVDNGIDQYVMVVSTAIERLLKNMGLALHRYGPPVRVGGMSSVACRLNVDAQTRHAILGHPLPVELAMAA
jgi:acyl homoserine lactone synthase